MAIGLVRLTGQEFDLRALAEHLRLPECTAREEKNSEYYLESSSFDDFDDVATVVERGQELIQRLNGVGRLLNIITEPVAFGGDVMRIKDDGKRDVYIFPPPLMARVRMSISRDGGSSAPEHSTAEIFILEAEGDPVVARAIRLFGQSHTWDNLYKVLDAIKEAVGGENQFKSRQWVTAGQLKRFTQTANSVLAVGDDARHGHTKTPAPRNPMSLSDATALIRTLLTELIRSRTRPPQ
jgi:hypothetical protein